MHILLATSGVAGDHYPFVAWGRYLAQHGHEVTLFGCATYQHLADRAGLPFVPVITKAEDDQRAERVQRSWKDSLKTGFQSLVNDVPPTYEALVRHIRPGQTVIAANFITLAGRLVQEKYRVPMATISLSPPVLRSPHDPLNWPDWMPGFLRQPAFNVLAVAANRRLKPRVDLFRKEIGLDPIRPPTRHWMLSPEMVINFFPEWLADRQPDWPEKVYAVGFPNPEPQDTPELSPAVLNFLNDGPPPIAISHSSGIKTAEKFFSEAVKLVKELNLRAIVLAPEAVSLPALPPQILRVPFASHMRLYPRSRLAIHHGGIGTTSAALAAGLPQFIVPGVYDQPENARRMRALGVGDYLAPARFRMSAAAPRVRTLLESSDVQRRCADFAGRIQNECAFEKATALLAQLAGVEIRPTLTPQMA